MIGAADTSSHDTNWPLQDCLASIGDDMGFTAAVMGVLLPLQFRRRTGFWWQVLEILMELAAPHQVSIH